MRTDSNLDALCEQLAHNCGDFFAACVATGLSVQFVQQWQKDDAECQQRLLEATRLGSMRLESVAIKRAVHGVIEPVFYQGEVCGYKSITSDGLLQTLLKGRLRETYAPDENTARMVFNGPTQINNMPRAGSYDEWLAMKDATNARLDQPRAALPAPLQLHEPPVIEGVFKRSEPAFAGLDL